MEKDLVNNQMLLPCPFCGWEKPSIFIDDQKLTICVVCKCGANSKIVPMSLVDSTKLAIDFWNMRANPFLTSVRKDLED